MRVLTGELEPYDVVRSANTSKRIAFGIVSMFPGGGLQRDCLAIAERVRRRGHEVVIHACRAHGVDAPLTLLPNDCYLNHAVQRAFARDFAAETAGRFDLVVGFDKLVGLDVLYCADPSVRHRVRRSPYLHALPRYRAYAALERDAFGAGSRTRIMMLSQKQRLEYLGAWNTDPDRVSLLPPTVAAGRHRPQFRAAPARRRMRDSLGCGGADWVWLSACVQPRTKGLDRVVRALAGCAEAQLMIAGLHENDAHALPLVRLARRLGVGPRIAWLGHREDIPQLMAAADLLVHPARYDTTGTVILEAIVNGLPVITTAACGYAEHVAAAGSGIVIPEPFRPAALRAALELAREPGRRAEWAASADRYGQSAWLYEGHARAADTILAACGAGEEAGSHGAPLRLACA
jgi:UDP-glucose:(heptosyl)LPS alpha-1,3-glucosyltransferase